MPQVLACGQSWPSDRRTALRLQVRGVPSPAQPTLAPPSRNSLPDGGQHLPCVLVQVRMVAVCEVQAARGRAAERGQQLTQRL